MNRYCRLFVLILLIHAGCYAQMEDVQRVKSLLLNSQPDSAHRVAQNRFSELNDSHVWGMLADLFLQHQQYRAAGYWLQKLYSASPSPALKQALYTIYFNQGLELLLESKPLPALDCFERARHLDSLHADLYHARANAWQMVHQPDKAIESLDAGIIHFPRNDSLHLHKISLLTQTETWRELKSALVDYLSFSDDLDYQLLLVNVLVRLNEPFEALETLEDLYAKHPVEKVRSPLIRFYRSVGKDDAALKVLADWKESCPECKDAWLGMIRSLLQIDRPDSSLAISKRVLKRWPQDPLFLEWGVQSAIAAKEPHVALQWAQRWTRVDSVNDSAWLALADLLQDSDPHEALVYYRRARHHPVAVYRLATLEDSLGFSPPSALQQRAFRKLVDALAHREQELEQQPAAVSTSVTTDRDSLRQMIVSLTKKWKGDRDLLIDEIEFSPCPLAFKMFDRRE